MAWLSEWLKEIIFIVLLSVFIEMLLPNRSMERYVKLVLSLLILMALLTPLMELLRGNPAEKLRAAIEEQLKPQQSQRSSLEQILQEGEKLRLSQQEDTLKWAGSETARQMKNQIEAGTGLDVDKVAVTLKIERSKTGEGKDAEEYDKPVISSVKVYLSPPEKADEAVMADTNSGKSPGSSKGTIQVPAVEPVHIGVGRIIAADQNADKGVTGQSDSGKTAENQAGPDDRDDQKVTAAPETADTEKIYTLLGGNWGIDRSMIQLLTESEGNQR
ncbi:stage III sporulation protein AF [Paenibacillus caui]|uniref:stage III sporulation protein AF n=1 Tax=Paenibacillus caui TaxID=2873927 RepID=UPI001CA9927A|nr:stage III sporulation protein AF [Paenibacillus caui]